MKLSKRASYLSDVLRILEREIRSFYASSGQGASKNIKDWSGVDNVSGGGQYQLDEKKAYQIMCTLESKCNFVIGDSGTSFGATQVQFGLFLMYLARDPSVKQVTGMSPNELHRLRKAWSSGVSKLRGESIWMQVPIDENSVRNFMRQNPNKVVKRREGTTIKYNSENLMIVKINKSTKRMTGYKIDLAKLNRLGLDINSSYNIAQLKSIIRRYITRAVAHNAVVKLFVRQASPRTYVRFRKLFTRKNVRRNQELKNLSDRVSQQDFSRRMRSVVSALNKSGYDTSVPEAYNVYQLLCISNASGVGRVQQFLFNKKKFSGGNLHSLSRANSVISKVTGISSSLPSNGGVAGFPGRSVMTASIKISKLAEEISEEVSTPSQAGQAGAIINLVERWVRGDATPEEMKPFGVEYIGMTGPNTITIRLTPSTSNEIETLLPAQIDSKNLNVVYTDAKPQLDPRSVPTRKTRITRELPAIGLIGPHIKELNYLLLRKNEIKKMIEEEWEKKGIKSKITSDELENFFVDHLKKKYPEDSIELEKKMKKLRDEKSKRKDDLNPGFYISKRESLAAKQAEFILKFPSLYTEDIRSGKREMTIRAEDIPVEINQVVKCETYSGAFICHVIITDKETMSVTRIRKAFGKKVANDLERRFGPNSRFIVVRFSFQDENLLDDDFGNNSYGKMIGQDPYPLGGGILEHIPSGMEMVPVEPGAYHACDDLQANTVIKCLWKIADDINYNADEEEFYKLHPELKPEEDDEFEEIDEEEKKTKELEEEETPSWYDESETKQVKKQQPKLVVQPEIPQIPLEEKPEELPKELPKSRKVPFTKYIKNTPAIVPSIKEDEDLEAMLGLSDEEEDILLEEDILEEGKEEGKEEEEEEAGSFALVPLKNKKTIYGFALKAPATGWGEPPSPPAMNEDIGNTITASAMEDGYAMSNLFSSPKTWAMLGRQKNRQAILQKWILPALLFNVGKRWFDVNSRKLTIGNTPFAMFSADEIKQAIKTGKTFQDTPSGKDYMHVISTYVTDAANSYFSLGRYEIPIGAFVYKVVDNYMKKELASRNDYKEKRIPICSVCKAQASTNKTAPGMISVNGRWKCEECENKIKLISENDIPQANNRINKIEKELLGLRQKAFQAQINIEDIGETPERVSLLEQAKQNYLTSELELKTLGSQRKEMYETIKNLGRQLVVPYFHTWCPNETCPGQRIPLTSIDWSRRDFWDSDKGKAAIIYMRKRFSIIPPWMDQEEQLAEDIGVIPEDMAKHHIPPEVMHDVPFECPHDGVKFTLRNAWGKGLYKRAGLFWEPWVKLEWITKDVGRGGKFTQTPAPDAQATGDNTEEMLAYEQLSGIARDIFLHKYWDKAGELQNLLKTDKRITEDPYRFQNFRVKAKNLFLYDTVRNFSAQDPKTYAAWLSNSELKKDFVENKDGSVSLSSKMVTGIKKKQDSVYIPIMQRWVQNLLKQENGFANFDVTSWLVSKTADGVGSFPTAEGKNQGKDGTFFIAKADSNGFNINLLVKKKRIKAKSSPYVKLLTILGVWELSQSEASGLPSHIIDGTYEFNSMAEVISLTTGKQNKVREIESHDFRNAIFSKESAQIVPGSYLLVQAYVMPTFSNAPMANNPLSYIRRMREDTGNEEFMQQFGQLAMFYKDDSKFWNKFKIAIQKIKNDPEKIKSLIETLLQQEKKGNGTNDQIVLSFRDYQ